MYTGGMPPREPILTEAEVARRMSLLAELQAALTAQGIRCVLARNHRLVLQYNRSPRCPEVVVRQLLNSEVPAARW